MATLMDALMSLAPVHDPRGEQAVALSESRPWAPGQRWLGERQGRRRHGHLRVRPSLQ